MTSSTTTTGTRDSWFGVDRLASTMYLAIAVAVIWLIRR